MIQQERIFNLTPGRQADGNVIYWMSREQRVSDNPGLLYARQIAGDKEVSLTVVFTLVTEFLGATLRQYDFMLKGLQEVSQSLKEKNIPFLILEGEPYRTITQYIVESNTGTVIVDFDPLKIKRKWLKNAINLSQASFFEVDGHNIVPARYASNKLEYGAYTLRPKIKRLLDHFLKEFQELQAMSKENFHGSVFSSTELLESLNIDRQVKPIDCLVPGEAAASATLNDFISNKLPGYALERNDPNKTASSNLSPYLHFGQISSQRIAIEVLKSHPSDDNSQSFLEELIVRKELSDNFCHYNVDYDNPNGFHDWAKKSIQEHKLDEREYLYSKYQFETGGTHDPLWNAAQMEMVKTGKMHGYMRMYWAKKILEWTRNVSEAMEIGIYLNDKFELDGRDPNGYAGIAWSIGGVHDRAWNERAVFGKIRYMNYNGCKRKFKVDEYIKRVEGMAGN